MASTLNAKSALGVLNGLSRRMYFEDETMSDEFLREQVGYEGSAEGRLSVRDSISCIKLCLLRTIYYMARAGTL